MRTRIQLPILLTIAVTLLVLTLPVIADDDRGGEIGFMLGGSFPDDDVLGSDADPGWTLGLRGGSVFSRHWGWFIDGLLTEFDGNLADTDLRSARTGFDLLLTPERDSRWFFSFGGGHMELEPQGFPELSGPFASIGVGMRHKLAGRTRLRWELRADQGLDKDDFGGVDEPLITHALVGLNWGPGTGGPATDTDGDGVADRRDRCPDTPRGAVVDKLGCPSDADGDGVFDGIDACADTASGWPVGADGCPRDSDGDGVPDGKDKCPDTPSGATVNADGCPTDSDGDGVPDGIDKCPDSPKAARVDPRGCTRDSDADGVVDGIDKCPDTPRGATVDAGGCPKDSDKDGVPDGIDKCPGTPAGVAVKADGCERATQLFEEEKRTLVLEGVYFETNRDVLTSASTAVLDRVVQSLRDWPEVRVEIGGHTDSQGAEGYNLNLSSRRAATVRTYLAGRGVAPGRMVVRGYGESKPVASNGNAGGRAKNRRVELTRLD